MRSILLTPFVYMWVKCMFACVCFCMKRAKTLMVSALQYYRWCPFSYFFLFCILEILILGTCKLLSNAYILKCLCV